MPREAKREALVGENFLPAAAGQSSFSLLVLGGMVSGRHSREPSQRRGESQPSEDKSCHSHPWVAVEQNQVGVEHKYFDNICFLLLALLNSDK